MGFWLTALSLQRHVAARYAHLSFCSSISAPMSRPTAASLGKMPMTSALRLTSLIALSRGLVDAIYAQWTLGRVI
jgi:hypothetical protein